MLDRVHASLGSEYVVNIMSITGNMKIIVIIIIIIIIIKAH